MRCDVVTLFPAPVEAYFAVGVLGRAAARGVVDLRVHNLRRWAINRYGQVDDEPFGGGPGMVLMAPVVVRAVQEILQTASGNCRVVLPDPRGRKFSDAVAQELAGCPHLVIVCGRYEGIDERAFELLQADEISLGDFVLSGGELAAMVIVDAVARHIPGVVGDRASVVADSFTSCLLDHPVYTRPQTFKGLSIPEVLVSGHHERIRKWRLEQAVRLTLVRRPDLLRANWRRLPAEVRQLVSELAERHGLAWDPPPDL